MLSLLEFQSLIESGAVVHCTTKEECAETLQFLEWLGFCIHDGSRDLSEYPGFFSPGLDATGTEICRYSNWCVEKPPNERLAGFYKNSNTVIEYDDVPFTELTNETSTEEFDEFFARLLAP